MRTDLIHGHLLFCCATLSLTGGRVSFGASGELDFESFGSYTTKQGPGRVLVADFNSDSFDDLAIVNVLESFISVWLNDGFGKFGDPIHIAMPGSMRDGCIIRLKAGDPVSVIAASTNTAAFFVLQSDGAGGFLAPVAVEVDTAPTRVISTDTDGDGDSDLVMLHDTDQGFSRYENNEGVFEIGETYDVTGHLNGIAITDIDEDGYSDIAVCGSDPDRIIVFKNNGMGQFSEFGTYLDAPEGFEIKLINVDGNTLPDIVTSSRTDHSISVFLNMGSGVFEFDQTTPAGADPSTFVDFDFEGDSDNDLLVLNRDDDGVRLMLNDGSGAFSPAGLLLVGRRPSDLAVIDLENDGDSDLAIDRYSHGQLLILRNKTIHPNQIEPDVWRKY